MASCRICYEPGKLISVCNCSGTTAGVHFDCIQKWINTSKRIRCEICHGLYKYPGLTFSKPDDQLRTERAILISLLLGMIHGITLWIDSHFEIQYLWIFLFSCVLFNGCLIIICSILSKFKQRFQKIIFCFYGGFILGEMPGHIITQKINLNIAYCYIFNISIMFTLLWLEYKYSRRQPLH